MSSNLLSNNPFASTAPARNPSPPDDLPPSYEDATASTSTDPRIHVPPSSPPNPPRPNPQIPSSPAAAAKPPPPPPQQQHHQRLPLHPQQHQPAAGPSSRSGHAPGPVARQFPPAFNVYADGWGRSYTLGEHQGAPLYAVRLHSGWSGEPDVVLHNGPSADRCPMLAAVDMSAWGADMTASLPPLRGQAGGVEVRIDSDFSGGWHRSYRFRVEAGAGGAALRPEAFEWRHSYGEAVAALGGQGNGWKLVRMETGAPAGAPAGGQFVGGGAGGGYQTSDGREVVAAWSPAGMSMSKSAKFQFLGTGNSGMLGERWAVMAVVSALGLWEKERRAKR